MLVQTVMSLVFGRQQSTREVHHQSSNIEYVWETGLFQLVSSYVISDSINGADKSSGIAMPKSLLKI